LTTNEHELRFRQLVAEHTGLLVKIVRSFAEGPADEDDLFQEILLQMWMALPSFREECKPTTWLYRVGLNTALAWKRSEKKRRRRHSVLSVSELAAQAPASTVAERNGQLIDRLYEAIRELPPAKRAIVVLYLDGFTYREIAEVVGISESNVGVSLNRIRQRLSASMKEGCDES
jgi:RNA polymerase sigma-70 factor, ECF subfamily